MTEEQKEKYANFLDKVSEILGLNKPVDILRLCAVTDEYLRPIEKRITELEKENAELKSIADFQTSSNMDRYFQLKRSKEQLTKAKEVITNLVKFDVSYKDDEECQRKNELYDKMWEEAEQFLSEV